MTDPPRLIGRKEAAAYCGVWPTCFSMWVSSGKMPPAIPGTRKWDRKAIDLKLDDLSGLAASAEAPSEDDEHPLSNYDQWKIKKQKRREKYRPQLGLDRKLERVLMFMANHPECETLDEIPLAGPSHIQWLIDKGAIRFAGYRDGVETYALTDEGKAEVQRIVKWWQHAP
ncbi:helix-turn-helix transcriptional regulator [Rhizobium grahamii]|uniref:Uncharacterized protein n=1 Tax=Rhizobium grahamii CCGE 502 TaxID=990285 RepID=S3I0A2_9HYPH|nr:hypothetical protein [Rhizobium grahamii]EPE98641.1 hypothetical protein RGCCGE502_09450 [Rhizobium grahamii CCGE 502]